ncbi:hypothetical protein PC129_g4522 [Phytophthora cactorum]|uniref:Uncharacterized protein n=1 Tax=Phytophthora cactorum TaxID=29920 RepID=A0A8T1IL67_9STRA|nr:hypothetical protein PC129_g4522 [Phytophthora cactorum]
MSLHYPGAPLNTDLQLSVAEEPKPKKPTTNKKPRKVLRLLALLRERTVKAQRKKSTETLLERESSPKVRCSEVWYADSKLSAQTSAWSRRSSELLEP